MDIQSVDRKAMHKLKVKCMSYLVEKTEDLSLGHSFSDGSEGLLWRGKGEATMCRGFGRKDQVVRTPKDYC